MLTFLFWVPKMPKTAENMFYPFINLWTTMKFGFQDQLFHAKAKKNLQGDLFCQCRSKPPNLAKIKIV